MGGSLFHAPFIAADPRLELTAVVTADAERQRAVRSRYPGTDVLGRTQDLLDRLDDVDLVVISTPNGTHAGLAEAVLSQGKPVVVDKPVTPTAEETRRLATLAHAVGHVGGALPESALGRRLSDRGGPLAPPRSGVLHVFESRDERWQPRVPADPGRAWKNERGAGILPDLGSHLVDQAVVLFGRPQGVYGDVAARRRTPAVRTTTSSSPSTTRVARGCICG